MQVSQLRRVILSLAPDHSRAIGNKQYYEELLQNRTLTKQQEEADAESNDVQSILSLKKAKNIKIKNQRPTDYLEERDVYERLCRQSGPQVTKKTDSCICVEPSVSFQLPPKREAKLFCRYRHNNHPYLLLQPAKEEQVLDEPVVFLFHDILTDSDIAEIQSLALPRVCLNRSSLDRDWRQHSKSCRKMKIVSRERFREPWRIRSTP